MERIFLKSFDPINITRPDILGVGKYHHCNRSPPSYQDTEVTEAGKGTGCDEIRSEFWKTQNFELEFYGCFIHVKWPDVLEIHRKIGKLGWSSPYTKRALTSGYTKGNSLLSLIEMCMRSASRKDAPIWLSQTWMTPRAFFVLAIALQTKFSLSNKFSRNLGTMPDTNNDYTCFVELEQAYNQIPSSSESLWKALKSVAVVRCWESLFTDWSSNRCIPTQSFVFVSVELNHIHLAWVLDSDKGDGSHFSGLLVIVCMNWIDRAELMRVSLLEVAGSNV